MIYYRYDPINQEMVRPTFLCIGVQKSGTTSLINYLNQHPDIFMKNGESHFFDTTEPTPEGIKKYENTFKTNKLIVGEKTPSYNYLRYAMDRIYNYHPDIKLILILREPIKRAFSQYNMMLNKMGKTLSDVNDEEIISELTRQEHVKLSDVKVNGDYYIIRGYYDEIVSYILSKFLKTNLYIGIAEEINEDKFTHYNHIFRFLGARPLPKINENMNTHVRSYRKPIPKRLGTKLYDIYKPHNENLYKILGRRIPAWENYYSTISEE